MANHVSRFAPGLLRRFATSLFLVVLSSAAAESKSVAFRGITQPNFTTCGQTSVAMISGVNVNSVIQTMGTDKGTTAGQLIDALRRFNPRAKPRIVQLEGKNPQLDSIVYLMDTSSGGGHWTVFHDGKYYDPVFGKIDVYPPWIRKQFAISGG